MRAIGMIALALAAIFIGLVIAGDHGPTETTSIYTEREQRETVAAMVRLAGYSCPDLKLAFAEGPGPQGDRVRLHCGPAGRDGVYEGLTYRLTWHPDGTASVRSIPYPG